MAGKERRAKQGGSGCGSTSTQQTPWKGNASSCFPKQGQRLGQGWGGEIQLGNSQGTFSVSFLHSSECTEQPSGAVAPCCRCQHPSSQWERPTAAQTRSEASCQHFSQWQVLLGKPRIKLSHKPQTISDSVLSPQIKSHSCETNLWCCGKTTR